MSHAQMIISRRDFIGSAAMFGASAAVVVFAAMSLYACVEPGENIIANGNLDCDGSPLPVGWMLTDIVRPPPVGFHSGVGREVPYLGEGAHKELPVQPLRHRGGELWLDEGSWPCKFQARPGLD